MTLGEILTGVHLEQAVPPGVAASQVSGVAYDSRKVAPGFLFFAFPGKHVDGGAFAAQAFERGALILGVGKRARRAEIIRGTYRGKVSSKDDPYSKALEDKAQ